VDETSRFETLVAIMDRLRDPDTGCPWDREQTYESLRGYLIEECYEVVDALDRGSPADLREELGDLLFQIVFLARLGKEQGAFQAADVVRGIATKMIRRHLHVFAAATAETSEDVLRNWEAIKREEKAGASETGTSVLDGVPRGLPAVSKAHRLGTKAARVGFDWPSASPVLDKVEEELRELRRAVDAGDRNAVRDELGDVLFSVVMLARKLDVDPEAALEGANRKFSRRFRRVEARLRAEDRSVDEVGPERLDALWNEAKES